MQQLSAATKNVAHQIAGHPSVEDCAARLVDVLPGVMWFVRRHMRRNRAKGLSVPAFRTMVLLSRNHTSTLSEVSEFLGSSMPTASRIVSCLVCKNLISRETGIEDRRQVALKLTEAGQAVLESAYSGTRAAVAGEITHLSADERQTVLQSFDILCRAFETTQYPLDADRGGEVCSTGDSVGDAIDDSILAASE